MTELKTNITDSDLLDIKSKKVIEILKTIKQIQKRMKDPEIQKLEYIEVYDLLSKEFEEFCDNNTTIFTKVVRGEDLNLIASILYYKDKVERGIITEAELSEILAKKYLPANLKNLSDMKIREMKQKEKI